MTFEKIHDKIMQLALAFPEAYEENPWGEQVVKVRNKIFLFAGVHDGRFGFTVKLPQSGAEMLTRPGASPTGYGLGKSGWVTFAFDRPADVFVDEIPALLEESYRAIAPKRLSKTLDDPAPKAASKKRSKSARGRIALVGSDETRLKRARTEFAAAGLETVAEGEPDPSTLTVIAKEKPDVVLIDLGRLAPHALEFARYLIDDLGATTRLAFAGARDAATEKKASSLGAIIASRQPPGDPEFVAALTIKGGFARAD